MKDGSSKAWDKTPRTYEIKWPDGKKVVWKDITARNCTEFQILNRLVMILFHLIQNNAEMLIH